MTIQQYKTKNLKMGKGLDISPKKIYKCPKSTQKNCYTSLFIREMQTKVSKLKP